MNQTILPTKAFVAQDHLEAMVDTFGMSQVLEMLAEVASLKSAHVLESYQDERLARKWLNASQVLSNISNKMEV